MESDFTRVAEFVNRGVEITQELKERFGPKLKDFKAALENETPPEIIALREEVEEFSKQFPSIGFEKSEMRYQD